MKIKFALLIIIFIFINGCFGKKVSSNELQERNGLYYLVNKSKPFSGVIINRYPNGFVSSKIKIKNGKKEGKYTEYFTTSLFVLGGGPSLIKEYKNGVLTGDVIKYNSLLFWSRYNLKKDSQYILVLRERKRMFSLSVPLPSKKA